MFGPSIYLIDPHFTPRNICNFFNKKMENRKIQKKNLLRFFLLATFILTTAHGVDFFQRLIFPDNSLTPTRQQCLGLSSSNRTLSPSCSFCSSHFLCRSLLLPRVPWCCARAFICGKKKLLATAQHRRYPSSSYDFSTAPPMSPLKVQPSGSPSVLLPLGPCSAAPACLLPRRQKRPAGAPLHRAQVPSLCPARRASSWPELPARFLLRRAPCFSVPCAQLAELAGVSPVPWWPSLAPARASSRVVPVSHARSFLCAPAVASL